jgi:peptide chain release factor 1
MFKKLDSVEQKFRDVSERLNSGSLEPKELQKLGKEHASLRETVETYGEYKQVKKDLEDNKEMLASESDEDLRALVKEEVNSLEAKLVSTEERLKVLLLPTDPNDGKNALLEIRAGTGGEEAALFVADLFRMYSRYAEVNGWKVDILSSSDAGKGGSKEVIALITGSNVFSKLKYESGVHRVQRVPETEASGRIHTSAVSVAVLPEAEEVDVSIPDKELRIDVMRAGGAGGQHVNTTDSAVRMTHLPTGLVVVCQDERSQHKNRAKAMKILLSRLLDLKQREQQDKEAAERKGMVGSGDRSEKIRTYNFPQSRITDHRVNFSTRALDDVLNGNLNVIFEPLVAYFQAELMKGSVN